MARVVHELRDRAHRDSAGMSPDDVGLARGLLDRGLADPELVDRLLVAPVVDALVELFPRRGGEHTFEVESDVESPEGPEGPEGPEAAQDPEGAQDPEAAEGSRGTAVTGGGVRLEVDDALVEVMRRSEEVWALPAATRSPDTVPLLLLELPATPADFDAEMLTMLASIDDVSNLGAIAQRVGYGFFDVARVVAGLYERGVVALTHPQAGLTTEVTQTVDAVQTAAAHAAGASHDGPSRLWVDHGQPDGTPSAPARTVRPTAAPAPASDASTPEAPASDASAPDAPDPDAPGTTASSDAARATDPPAATDPAAVTGGAAPHRSDDGDEADVSEFLRELSSLANRDDTRTRRTSSPAQTPHGRSDPHDGDPAGAGDDPGSRSGGDDDDSEVSDGRGHPGSASPPDGGRRRRRGFFGRS